MVDVGFEDFGELVESAGADSVGAGFVFLDLLEADIEFCGEFFLAPSEEGSALAHPLSDS